jgi:transposase
MTSTLETDGGQKAAGAIENRLTQKVPYKSGFVSIPGFGDATACILLIDMPELGSMDAKQTGSLAGLAPVTRQSGNWKTRVMGLR